ncbi:zinc-binding dehydrogenase [Luminiphilus sp.]|nr:zinc-binding dehydrogenase [Luminiphilus sp.]
MKSLQMQSCVHDEGTIECALFDIDVPAPSEKEVMVKIEASPINPSDLGLMFGAADIDSIRASERNGHPSIILNVPPPAMRAMATRINEWLPVGNEACGTVVEAGASPEAQALLGKRVALFGGEMYSNYRTISVFQCIPLAEDTTPEEGASCFVNPMTALGFVETMKMEGHKAIVHTAAASNLGQMLNRICLDDGVPLVNVVRNEEQVALLKGQGAAHVVNSSDDDFAEQLAAAVNATGATLAFDAIGGGKLGNAILMAMEAGAVERMTEWSRYGSNEYKQLYIYGALDLAPTTLNRGYGFSWGIGGWLLTPFMMKAGGEVVRQMQAKVVAELTTTFASHYSDRVSLAESLTPQIGSRYGVRRTGQKTLITF